MSVNRKVQTVTEDETIWEVVRGLPKQFASAHAGTEDVLNMLVSYENSTDKAYRGED